ncbi:Transmembrane domain-containing protein [Spironucleus salmonicida]|uniref:Transmembrane domain-containing protein n=1 Tax=Spironucleus salmonicida TaxID=348837 RepID=V6LS20_9EUKA|nr:Transmembrane domain-containing protein [Spironucleus salmonicida]|eukprot:EST47457.1 Transmembrane domain-containing protein [Spironucleus salmonicida]
MGFFKAFTQITCFFSVFIVGFSALQISIDPKAAQEDVLFYWFLFGVALIADHILYFLPYYFVLKATFFIIIAQPERCQNLRQQWLPFIIKFSQLKFKKEIE